MIEASLKVRRARRIAIEQPATLRSEDDGAPHDIAVENLSETGCLIYSPQALAIGTEITLGIAGIGRRRATVQRIEGQMVGCVFAKPLGIVQVDRARSNANQVYHLRVMPGADPVMPAMPANIDEPALTNEPIDLVDDREQSAPTAERALRTSHLLMAAALIVCALIFMAVSA